MRKNIISFGTPMDLLLLENMLFPLLPIVGMDKGYEEITKHSMLTKEIQKGEDAYKVEIDIPGFTKEEISISIKKDILCINAKKEDETQRKNISRSYKLENMDVEKIEANLENGVLSITIPFLQNDEEELKIDIK